MLGSVAWGTWHHAVVRYDGASDRPDGFLDGARSAASTGDRAAPWEYGFEQRWALGPASGLHLGSGAALAGVVDEFAVYSRALSDARVASHWAARAPAPATSAPRLGLKTSTSWERAGSRCRRAARVLPAGQPGRPTATYAYWGEREAADVPCPGGGGWCATFAAPQLVAPPT